MTAEAGRTTRVRGRKEAISLTAIFDFPHIFRSAIIISFLASKISKRNTI
jgi:hypothetical protein